MASKVDVAVVCRCVSASLGPLLVMWFQPPRRHLPQVLLLLVLFDRPMIQDLIPRTVHTCCLANTMSCVKSRTMKVEVPHQELTCTFLNVESHVQALWVVGLAYRTHSLFSNSILNKYDQRGLRQWRMMLLTGQDLGAIVAWSAAIEKKDVSDGSKYTGTTSRRPVPRLDSSLYTNTMQMCSIVEIPYTSCL